MREQRTLALARVLQACARESSCPTGVLCEAARELQWCMAPLLALNGDKIVVASLLQSVKGECGTSPTPEEEAVLLSDIKSDIQSDIGAPQVPELLEIHEQAQPTGQSFALTSSPLSPPSPPSTLPPLKAKKPQSRTPGADVIDTTQWVHFYLEENIECLSGGENYSPYFSVPVIP